jgi:hypothetical protein
MKPIQRLFASALVLDRARAPRNSGSVKESVIRKTIPLLVLLFSTACGTFSVPRPFLHASGTQLRKNGVPYRNVGANMPDLFVRFLLDQDAGAQESLDVARAAGIRFVRCFGATWGTKNFDIFEKDRDRWFSAYERMLSAAHKREIEIVPSLMFNAGMIPAYIRENKRGDDQIVEFLTPGTPSNELAVEYVTAIVSRFKDDRRILFWEIGNEYNLMADLSSKWQARPPNEIPTSSQVRAFLVQMAILIKTIDPNHMVTAGHSEMRPYAWHIRQSMLSHVGKPDQTAWPMDWTADTYLQYVEIMRVFNPPPLDLISVHHYPLGTSTPPWVPRDDTRDVIIDWTRAAADDIGLPLFIGEFGQETFLEGREQAAPFTADVLRRIVEGVVPIAAIWSWEFDREPQHVPFSLSIEKTPAIARRILEVNRLLRRGSVP